MSKRKFDDDDDSLHSSIAVDDNYDDTVAVSDAEYYDHHPSSTTNDDEDDDNREHNKRVTKKARCDRLIEEATTSKQINKQLNNFIATTTPNHENCAIGNDDVLVSSSLNKLQQPFNRKRVSFGAVSIYYFQRSQGFSCVPTSGGSTLGMSRKHHLSRVLSLTEHLDEVRRQRELYVEQQRRLTPTTSRENQQQQIVDNSNQRLQQQLQQQQQQQQQQQNNYHHIVDECGGGDDDESGVFDGDEEFDEEYDEEFDEQNEVYSTTTTQSPEETISSSNNDYYGVESNESAVSTALPDDYYLQPLDSKQRRSILRAIGIQVDRDEREECQSIRVSRQSCGCSCRGQCLPESCACAVEQIKCQVDRPTFPCGCTKNTCFNPFGRVEFNAVRVRTHYLHTMMRLRIENKQQTAIPPPTHVRFEENGGGYVDVVHQDVQNDLSSTPVSSSIPGFHTFSSSSTTSSCTLPSSSSSVGNVTTVIQNCNNNDNNSNGGNNFWHQNNNNCCNGTTTSSSSSSSYLSLNDNGGATTAKHVSFMEPMYDDVRVNGYHRQHQENFSLNVDEEDDEDEDDDDDDEEDDDENEEENREEDDENDAVLTMRERSSSFCLKTTPPKISSTSTTCVLLDGRSPTYTLASLYPHQNQHYTSTGRTHSFNEFLDPLYFPTFALSSEYHNNINNNNHRCSSEDDDDDDGDASSSFPSDESNSLDATTANNASTSTTMKSHHSSSLDVVGCSTTPIVGASNASTTSPTAYLPSSPAELSAVLKKSICETVLA